MRRFFSFILVLALLCAMCSFVTASEFSDVPQGIWYEKAVSYVVEKGLMNGVGSGRFEPESKMTRAMLVTVLWRYSESPCEGRNVFTDVENGKWFTQAIAWAAQNEIVRGVGNGRFNPNGNITREQLALILYRFSQWANLQPQAQGDLSSFEDSDLVSSWAAQGISWAVGAGLMKGNGKGLNPPGNATRAEVATLLMRYIETFTELALPQACEHPTTEVCNVSEPTCTTNGHTGDICCSECGYILISGETIDMLGHNFVDGCCTRCDASEPNTEYSLLVDGRVYKIGMTLNELLATAGTADETYPSVLGYQLYVFGTSTYTNFFVAGVENGKVVTLFASGLGFRYRGRSMGDATPDNAPGCNVYTDRNNAYIFTAVQITDPAHWTAKNYSINSGKYTAQTLQAESKVCFHFTNAFRVAYGRKILTWSDTAATAARLHSEDMAQNDYFSHVNLDGKDMSDRLEDQGIDWRACAENIAGGYATGFDSFVAWVNSSGHRNNMLSGMVTHLGIGFAYNSNSQYRVYATQNFFA